MNKDVLLRETIRSVLNEGNAQFGSIYCDMDGVIVDFESGAIDLLTQIFDGNADPKWTEGSKTIHKNVEKLMKEMGPDWRPASRHDLEIKDVRQVMLSAISSAPGDFFGSLSPLADGVRELWPFLNSLGAPVHVLSAPVRGRQGVTPTAGDGKIAWCDKYLNPPPTSIIIADAVDKPSWAVIDGVPNILVDDKKKTVDAWNDRGGIGILHIPGRSSLSIKHIRQALLD